MLPYIFYDAPHNSPNFLLFIPPFLDIILAQKQLLQDQRRRLSLVIHVSQLQQPIEIHIRTHMFIVCTTRMCAPASAKEIYFPGRCAQHLQWVVDGIIARSNAPDLYQEKSDWNGMGMKWANEKLSRKTFLLVREWSLRTVKWNWNE